MTLTGWRTRGYLPHRDESHLVQHLVFNLADALPNKYTGPDNERQRLRWIDRELDTGHGSRLLGVHANALIVEECVLRDHGIRCALVAWCIMPTHVHIVMEQFHGHELAVVVHTWKSVTAHAINKRLGRSGPLWQREYFDRFMRNEEQYEVTCNYVVNNPVAAGLIARREDWRFSSAWAGRE